MEEITQSDRNKRKVAIYIRVSTAEQKIEGYSLQAQKKKLLDYVNNNKALNLVTKPQWIFEDAHTGSDLNRPSLQKLRKMVKERRFDALLVWKVDRLSRSLKHLLTIFEELEQNKVSFVSVQENIDFKGAIGKLIFQIFGAIAQFERELIKGRTLMGRIASAELGNYTGSNIPYGYMPVPNKSGKGKKIATVPDEKKWVEKMFEWYVYEDIGFLQIANKLNKLKVPKGKYQRKNNITFKWTDDAVGKIIKNPLYKGDYVANKKDECNNELPEEEWTIVKIPPCISEYLFLQAHSLLGKRKGAHSRNRIYILSGKLKDMTLDNPKTFVGCKRTKGGFSYRRQQFTDSNGTYHKVFEVPAKQLDDYVIEKIKQALQDPKIFIDEYLSKEYSDTSKIKRLEEELDHVRERRMNLELSQARIEHAYESGSYSEDKMVAKLTKLNKEMNDFDNQIQNLEDELRFVGSVNVEVQKLQEASKQIKYKLENLDRKQKRILVDLFVDKVEMTRKKEGKRWRIWADITFRFNPDLFTRPKDGGRTAKGLKLKDNTKKFPVEQETGAIDRD